MVPSAAIVNPGGRLPPVTDQVSGGVGVCPATGAEYAVPTVPFGSVVVVMQGGWVTSTRLVTHPLNVLHTSVAAGG